MAVYVDDMYKLPIGQFKRMKMSHLIADSEEELHEMADKIGLRRSWYQGDHYDISLTHRKIAVREGAVEVGYHQLAYMSKRQKIEGHCGKPENAKQWYREYRRTIKGKQL